MSRLLWFNYIKRVDVIRKDQRLKIVVVIIRLIAMTTTGK
jgi:hypothetical protein